MWCKRGTKMVPPWRIVLWSSCSMLWSWVKTESIHFLTPHCSKHCSFPWNLTSVHHLQSKTYWGHWGNGSEASLRLPSCLTSKTLSQMSPWWVTCTSWSSNELIKVHSWENNQLESNFCLKFLNYQNSPTSNPFYFIVFVYLIFTWINLSRDKDVAKNKNLQIICR